MLPAELTAAVSSDQHDDASFDRKLETFGLVETRPSASTSKARAASSSSGAVAGPSGSNKRGAHVLDVSDDEDRKPDVKPYIPPAPVAFKSTPARPGETPRERYDRVADDLESLEVRTTSRKTR